MPLFGDFRRRRKSAQASSLDPYAVPDNPAPFSLGPYAIPEHSSLYTMPNASGAILSLPPTAAGHAQPVAPSNAASRHSRFSSVPSLPLAGHSHHHPHQQHPHHISLDKASRPPPLQPQSTWSHPPRYHVPEHPARAGHELDHQEKVNDKLSDVISLIDEESFTGTLQDLTITIPDAPSVDMAPTAATARAVVRHETPAGMSRRQGGGKTVNVFSKLDLYLNSRLPVSLPPLRVYIPTWPVLCLAAQHSASAYLSPQSAAERKNFVSADTRSGTKAMVIKSVPCDDKRTIVFAIRGTSMLNVRDWGVNLHTEPVSPAGFLDDPGNLCHAGFLRVAQAMARPIAARLRQLLQENPSRTSCSLLITGHSAGGAVASLLYAHMLSATVRSDLHLLTSCFKRVHCVTFGAPPVSLLPLQKPAHADPRLRKCLFFSIINEGDPVVRAEKAYVKSLVDLLSSPVPTNLADTDANPAQPASSLNLLGASLSRLDLTLKPTKKPKPAHTAVSRRGRLWWDVPQGMLSNAGRLVVLRVPDGATEADVTASVIQEEQLRQVMFGDPVAHTMSLYGRRIETLAFRAVTGRAAAC